MLKSECPSRIQYDLKDKNMLIKSIRIKGMLSFQDMSLDLRPLNVLIGPNASGKSNLIEIIAMLQSLPRDLAGFIRQSGGISEWLWKGNGLARSGRIEAVLHPNAITEPLRYALEVNEAAQYMTIIEELLESERIQPTDEPYSYFRLRNGSGMVRSKSNLGDWLGGGERGIKTAVFSSGQSVSPQGQFLLQPGQSVLHEIRHAIAYPEMESVRGTLDAIHFYREPNLGRNSVVRNPQPTDLPNHSLLEDFSNLALVLNHMRSGIAIREIEHNLQQFYENYEQVGVGVEANTAQLWIREKGLQDVIPATRLSDGTLRFLALLTILCHPTPPPLICIEEPELGLHPDIIPQIAKLLLSASERTQLIVTTHSKDLIDQLWEDPEGVIVCERDFDAGSEFKRLSADKLEKWLERYELGELWEKGVLGGKRW